MYKKLKLKNYIIGVFLMLGTSVLLSIVKVYIYPLTDFLIGGFSAHAFWIYLLNIIEKREQEVDKIDKLLDEIGDNKREKKINNTKF
jgi:predicted tellurium resistance membrane protein TerC